MTRSYASTVHQSGSHLSLKIQPQDGNGVETVVEQRIIAAAEYRLDDIEPDQDLTHVTTTPRTPV